MERINSQPEQQPTLIETGVFSQDEREVALLNIAVSENLATHQGLVAEAAQAQEQLVLAQEQLALAQMRVNDTTRFVAHSAANLNLIVVQAKKRIKELQLD